MDLIVDHLKGHIICASFKANSLGDRPEAVKGPLKASVLWGYVDIKTILILPIPISALPQAINIATVSSFPASVITLF